MPLIIWRGGDWKMLKSFRVPGQSTRKHCVLCTGCPSLEHSNPPFAGGGLVHVRLLTMYPGPHECEQGDQLLQ